MPIILTMPDESEARHWAERVNWATLHPGPSRISSRGTTIRLLGHYGASLPHGWQNYRDCLAAMVPFEASSLTGYPVADLEPSVRITLSAYAPSYAYPGGLPTEWRRSLREADYVVYSYQTPIAWHLPAQACVGHPDRAWIIPDVRYSQTTSRHQSLIRTAIAQLPRTYPYTNDAGETVWACCESSIGQPCAHAVTREES